LTSLTASSLMWKISYVLSMLFRHLVILMRYDSFCFVNKKHPVSSATTHKRRFAWNTHKEQISRQQFGLGRRLKREIIVGGSTDCWIPGSWTQNQYRRPPFCQIYRITPIKLILEMTTTVVTANVKNLEIKKLNTELLYINYSNGWTFWNNIVKLPPPPPEFTTTSGLYMHGYHLSSINDIK